MLRDIYIFGQNIQESIGLSLSLHIVEEYENDKLML